LAALVNSSPFGTAGGSAGFTATADGDSLIIVNLDGADFGTQFAVLPAPGTLGGLFTVTRVAATHETWTVALSGSASANEVWRLLLNVGGVTTEFRFVVPAGGATTTAIASALRSSVDAALNADWTITSAGGLIQIVKTTPGVFSVGFEILPFVLGPLATATSVLLEGTPVSGDIWTVQINGNPATTYTVNGSLGTLESIAASFASQINLDSDAADFTASTDGTALVIVNRLGVAFTTTFFITLADDANPGTPETPGGIVLQSTATETTESRSAARQFWVTCGRSW
jgi:phage tail sheath gpL-like